MKDDNKLLPDNEAFFPKGSVITLVVHFGMGLFFIVTYFLFYANIETFKMLILFYYTIFSALFLFFYHEQLRVRRIFLIWVVIAVIQLFFYFVNVNNQNWNKWSFGNVLCTLSALPVVLALYQAFRRISLQREGKELVIGFRKMYKPTQWDIAATIIIPLIAILVCLF